MISYYLKAAAGDDVKITIADAAGKVIRNLDGTKKAGINRVLWDLAPILQPPTLDAVPEVAEGAVEAARQRPSIPEPTSLR